jgi:hypothetical protein
MISIGATLFGVVCGWVAFAVARPSGSWRSAAAVAAAGAVAPVMAGAVAGWSSALYAAGGLFVGVVGHTAWRGALERMARHNR